MTNQRVRVVIKYNMKIQEFKFGFVFVALTTLCLVNAQYAPPRLQIPGAVPSPIAHSPVVRVRRPVALRSQNVVPNSIPSRSIEDAKPVTESAEDETPDVFLPQLLREQQLAQAQQAQFQQAAAAFLNNDQNAIQETPISHLLGNDELLQGRFPERTQQPTAPSAKPVFNDFGIGSNAINGGRFNPERHQPQPAPQPAPVQRERVNVVRNRPTAIREQRPQYDSQPAPAPQRPRPKPIQSRPILEQNQLQEDRDVKENNRRQRPVSQTIRKWREENEDGSIAWGYENDDGSFKEEIIGTDCVTKGTYGYVDPDGNKREYHYETGIKCDPNRRDADDEIQENGFINYEDNKAVLPNGIEIDMSQVGKKKSNRPGVNYNRN